MHRQVNSPSENQAVGEVFDAYEGNYADTVNRSVSFTGLDVDFFTRVKARYIRQIVDAELADAEGLDLLDIGCGVGNYHGLLAEHFQSITGVDVSRASVEKAGERHPDVTYRHYEGEVLPFSDGSFDVAYTICVMHHVPPGNWARFVCEAHRVLRPGGVFLVFEHNPWNPLTRRAVNQCPFDADAVLLSRPKTVSLLSEAGFCDVTARSILTLPPLNDILFAADGLLGRLPFGGQYYVQGRK